MPHETPGVFHMLLRHSRGFGLSDLEEQPLLWATGHWRVTGFAGRRRSKPPLLSPVIRAPLAQASRLKLAAKAVEQGGSRRLLKEKKFSPGRRAYLGSS